MRASGSFLARILAESTSQSGRLLPITLSGLFDIERAKPGDELAAVQVEDLCWLANGSGGADKLISAYRLRRQFSRSHPRQHLHLPCTYGELSRKKPVPYLFESLVEREGLEPSTPAL